MACHIHDLSKNIWSCRTVSNVCKILRNFWLIFILSSLYTCLPLWDWGFLLHMLSASMYTYIHIRKLIYTYTTHFKLFLNKRWINVLINDWLANMVNFHRLFTPTTENWQHFLYFNQVFFEVKFICPEWAMNFKCTKLFLRGINSTLSCKRKWEKPDSA